MYCPQEFLHLDPQIDSNKLKNTGNYNAKLP